MGYGVPAEQGPVGIELCTPDSPQQRQDKPSGLRRLPICRSGLSGTSGVLVVGWIRAFPILARAEILARRKNLRVIEIGNQTYECDCRA